MAPVALVGTRKDALRRRVDAVLAAVVPAAFAGPKAVAERLFCDRARFDATGTLGSVHWGRRGGGIRSGVPVAPGARLLDALLRPMKSVRGG